MRVDKLPAIVIDGETFYEKVVRPSMDDDVKVIDMDKYDIVAVSPLGEDDDYPLIIFNDFDGRDKLIKKLDELGVLIRARDTAALVLIDKLFGKERPIFCGIQEDERKFMECVEKYRQMKEDI